MLADLTERQRVQIELYARHNVIDGVSRPVADGDEPGSTENMDPAQRLEMIARALGAKGVD